MQISATPIKWTIPFAANDSAKVELPATTADPTRFSLSLGSPPLTGQPPESGGVPPQLEDFNGAMNQIARFTWWAMGGAPLPYDATWSADPNVNGYANGARIATADGRGEWICIVDNNTVNPDTVGTNWVPGYNYGSLALTGQTGGTVTLTPAQAVKRSMSVAGVLTSNLTIVVPIWLQEWTVTNTTTGAFTVTVKTAAGSGVVVPQNSAPTRVRGDGTNVTQLAENVAAATSGTQPMQLGQATGRLIARRYFSAPGSVAYVPSAGTLAIDVTVIGGGGGGGGATTTGAGQVAAGGGGGGGGFARRRYTTGFASGAVILVGSGGLGNAGATGGSGSVSTFTPSSGTAINGFGGSGSVPGTAQTAANQPSGGAGAGASSGGDVNAAGFPGSYAVYASTPLSGGGGGSFLGGGAFPVSSTSGGNPGVSPGSGGSGAANLPTAGIAAAGGAGAAGIVIIEEYS